MWCGSGYSSLLLLFQILLGLHHPHAEFRFPLRLLLRLLRRLLLRLGGLARATSRTFHRGLGCRNLRRLNLWRLNRFWGLVLRKLCHLWRLLLRHLLHLFIVWRTL